MPYNWRSGADKKKDTYTSSFIRVIAKKHCWSKGKGIIGDEELTDFSWTKKVLSYCGYGATMMLLKLAMITYSYYHCKFSI